MTDPLILVDTREQSPWSFPDGVRTERRGLPEGDYAMVGPTGLYSIEGLERRIVIERKSLGDAVQTLIQGWIRFRKELNRLGGYDLAVIAIEANVGDVLEHRYESAAEPAAVLARADCCLVDHGIPCMFWGNREYAQVMAWRLLRVAWQRYGSK